MLLTLLTTTLISLGVGLNLLTPNFNNDLKKQPQRAVETITIEKNLTETQVVTSGTLSTTYITRRKCLLEGNTTELVNSYIRLSTTYYTQAKLTNNNANESQALGIFIISNYYTNESIRINLDAEYIGSHVGGIYTTTYETTNNLNNCLNETLTASWDIKEGAKWTGHYVINREETTWTNNVNGQTKTQTREIVLQPQETKTIVFKVSQSTGSNTFTLFAKKIRININNVIIPETQYEVIDIPQLMFTIITLPFSFISQAFNPITLFEGTPYQVNIGNLIFVIISILIIIWIITEIIKMSNKK